MPVNKLIYKETVKELFDLQIFAIKMGLDNIRFLCETLGNPQEKYPVIHIAGTNGKGSTAFFIAALLQEAGLKTGLFTSPHLVDFRERITINGEKINPEFIQTFWQDQKLNVLERQATFFDTTTALAFDYFAQQNVDVAIIETGLGGRLDSTNIVNPKAVVLTPIDFDHEKQLGNTLTQIAGEKAAIIKSGTTVFCAQQQDESLAVIRNHLSENNTFYYLPEISEIEILNQSLDGNAFTITNKLKEKTFLNLKSKQIGPFQHQNQALAYFVADWYLKQKNLELKTSAIENVFSQKTWAGRLQLIQEKPAVYMDVSHNLAGVTPTLDFLRKFIPVENLHILVALVDDKNYQQIAQVISAAAADITVTEVQTPRKLAAEELEKTFNEIGKTVTIIKDLREAYDFCKKQLKMGDTLLVIGSHYLVGSLLDSGN